jgi:hypothetical protein
VAKAEKIVAKAVDNVLARYRAELQAQVMAEVGVLVGKQLKRDAKAMRRAAKRLGEDLGQSVVPAPGAEAAPAVDQPSRNTRPARPALRDLDLTRFSLAPPEPGPAVWHPETGLNPDSQN